jgi:hypothetical protein
MLALIAAHRFARLQVVRSIETQTSEHSAHRSRGVAGLLGDLLARQALAAEPRSSSPSPQALVYTTDADVRSDLADPASLPPGSAEPLENRPRADACG